MGADRGLISGRARDGSIQAVGLADSLAETAGF